MMRKVRLPERRYGIQLRGRAGVSSVASCSHCGFTASNSRHSRSQSGIPEVRFRGLFKINAYLSVQQCHLFYVMTCPGGQV